MDQEKRIRITADVSPLREIRQEIENLTKSMEDLSRTSVDAPDFDKNSFDRKLTEMRQKLSDLEAERKKAERSLENQPSAPQPNTSQPTEGPEGEIPRERAETPVENEPRENLDRDRRAVAPQSQPDAPQDQPETPEEQSGVPIDTPREPNSRDSNTQLSVLRQILDAIKDGNNLATESTSYLESLTREKLGVDADIPPVVPPADAPGNESPADQRERDRRDRRGNYTGIPGALVRSTLQAYSAAANSRNTYEAGAAEIGAVGQTAGTIVSAGSKMAGGAFKALPFAGDAISTVMEGAGELAGAALSGVAQLVSTYAMRAVAKAEELERNVLPYSQITRASSSEAKSQALSEGAYAARDLGMNAGEYMKRRSELLRSAGGKVLGATEEDPNGINEARSQMAAQRLYGIDDSSVNQLQSTLRFARNNTEDYGTSGNSPSGVIRLFENTMRELKLPFSEIAATIGESLQTFNKTSERILSKAGDFDAGKVATILSNIRAFTGMEGRQLERVQTAITGEGISQDDVTQALLLRVGRELMPQGTLSDIMEKIETMGDDTDFQVAFLKRLDEMTSTDEQLIQIMKSVFTNLGIADIKSLLESRDKQGGWDFLKERGAPEVMKGNEREAQYSRSAASRTVGSIEAATAEKTNRDAANGESMLGILSSIDSKIVQLATNSGLMEKTTKGINEALDALVKLTAVSNEEQLVRSSHGRPLLTGSAIQDNQWKLVPESSLLGLLLSKMGID